VSCADEAPHISRSRKKSGLGSVRAVDDRVAVLTGFWRPYLHHGFFSLHKYAQLAHSYSHSVSFTHSGVDNLTELVKMVKADPDLLRRYTPSERHRRGPHRMLTVNLANMRENGARALAAALLASEMAAGSGSRYRKLVSFGLMPNLPPPTRLKSADSFREKYRALCGFRFAFISPRHASQAKSGKFTPALSEPSNENQ
jgi:hypothetical protein